MTLVAPEPFADLDAVADMSPAELDTYLRGLRTAPHHHPGLFAQAVEAGARLYLNAQRPRNTQDAYAGDVTVWTRFCDEKGLNAELGELLPVLPSLLVAFVVWMRHQGVVAKVRGKGLVRKPPAPATMHRRVAGVVNMLRATHGVLVVPAGVSNNATTAINRYEEDMARGRTRVTRGQALVITLDEVRQVCLATPDTLAGLRNRGMLALWWHTGWRVSEIAARHVDDVTDVGRLLRVRADWSKTKDKVARITSQPGSPLNPVALWRSWLAESGIADGPVFREVDRHGNVGTGELTRESVRRIFIRMCTAAGLALPFTAHSIRHGAVTTLIDKGVPRHLIEQQAGFAPNSQHLDNYHQDRALDEHNASHHLGL